MRQVRRSILSPCHLGRQMHAWLTALLPLLRVAIPTLFLVLFWDKAQTVSIRIFRIEISATTMWVLFWVFHTVSMFYGSRSLGRGGLGYELCCSFMATELWLFLYYIQYQPIGAMLLLMIYIIGWIVSETRGRRWQPFLDDDGLMTPFFDSDASSKPAGFLSAARRRYAVMAAAGLLLVPSILTLSSYSLDGVQHRSKLHAQIGVVSDNPMMANLSTIGLLSNSTWEAMDIQEKLDTLQIIADIETGYLQIEPVSVVPMHLEDNTLGSYDAESRTIKIDFDQHTKLDAMKCLNTLLHECRHAFQHDCVDSLNWRNAQVLTGPYYAQARQWRADFISYTGSNINYDAYRNQAVEVDAREYADEVEDIYYQYWYLSNLPVR